MSRARDLANGTFSGAFSADSPTLVVDAANNRVGVGTASPTANLDVASSNATIHLTDTDDTTYGEIRNNGGTFTIASDEGAAASASSINFRVDGTERARLHNGGSLSVGTTSESPSSGNILGCAFYIDSGGGGKVDCTRDDSIAGDFNRKSSTGAIVYFRYAGTMKGYVGVTTTSASYNTSSDYRLKENVTELTNAIDRVKQIPVHRFNFIADPDKTVDGFLAHEVEDHVPEAVTGAKDAVDENGDIDPQVIDQSKLVPLLTAAIKEQQAMIEDLKTRLAALETA